MERKSIGLGNGHRVSVNADGTVYATWDDLTDGFSLMTYPNDHLAAIFENPTLGKFLTTLELSA